MLRNQKDLIILNDVSTWLEKEYSDRCKRNPRYSLRAFSNLLDLDASSVSKYMSNKRKPSHKMIKYLCEKLETGPLQETRLLSNVNLKKISSKNNTHDHYENIDLDKFYFISDWYHISILELCETKGFNSQPKEIASSLDITVQEAKSAVSRLQRLGLIKKTKSSFKKTNKGLSNFKPGLTSKAHKSYQRQIIEKSLDAIAECPPHEKDITSISMAIDETKIPAAKKLIEEFRKSLCQFLESGEQTRVYNLSVQLIPMSKKEMNS